MPVAPLRRGLDREPRARAQAEARLPGDFVGGSVSAYRGAQRTHHERGTGGAASAHIDALPPLDVERGAGKIPARMSARVPGQASELRRAADLRGLPVADRVATGETGRRRVQLGAPAPEAPLSLRRHLL